MPTPLPQFADLPYALFRAILEFAVPDDRYDTSTAPGSTQLMVKRLGLVSVAWYMYTREFNAERDLHCVGIRFPKMTRQILLTIRRGITLRGPHLREAYAAMQPPPNETVQSINFKPLQATQALIAFIVRMPHLEVLDLSKYVAPYNHVAMIVRVASKHCPKMRKLLLPDRPFPIVGNPHLDGNDMDSLVTTVYSAMEGWRKNGMSGGLRQLLLLHRRTKTPLARSVEFLNRICSLCPLVESLDGSFIADDLVVDRRTWERFCSTCTQLQKFEWRFAPIATEYFEIFGRYPKPHLKTMNFTASKFWNWDVFQQGIGVAEAARLQSSGFGANAKRASAVMKACPSLQSIQIVVPTQVASLEPTQVPSLEPQLTTIETLMQSLTRPKNSLNQEIFGDDFWDVVVRECPLLEEASVFEDTNNFARTYPIMSFTDASLCSLAKAKHLCNVSLKATYITGGGIFDLFNSACYQDFGQRYLCFHLGDNEDTMAHQFYDVVEGFFRRLAYHRRPLRCSGKRVALQLSNACARSETQKWSSQYIARLKVLIRAVRARHPEIRFRLMTLGFKRGESFNHIASLELLTTASAIAPDKTFWGQLPACALVDDVFVIREVVECNKDAPVSGRGNRTGMPRDSEDEAAREEDHDGVDIRAFVLTDGQFHEIS